MKNKIHIIMAVVAMLCIATFLTASLTAELLGNELLIANVKSLIVMPGLFILVPAVAITGASGFSLAGTRGGRLIAIKKGRMPFIAANGILVLVPAAIFLDKWAASGFFDVRFYSLQTIEIIFGATNLVLMGLNTRDGLRLTGKLRNVSRHSD